MPISKIVQNSLSDTISLGPKITSIQVANSTYVVKDDTNINIGGGYIVITGSGFQSNCSVIVDSNLACSVAFVSSTQVRAELPAKSAGTYNIYLLNGDGGTAIRVNALQYSNTPTWVTTSPLTSQVEDSNVSIQLDASGANTYSLQTGSTLPTGLTLSANGLISGTVNTNASVDTTFNFTVEAIDTELQETPKAFAVTITVGEADFYRTTLLLNGDGTNGANNNVFSDSSNNNFAITRSGNASQGSVSPFSPAGWSNFFDGSGDYLTVPDNAAFDYGSGDFTLECWFLPLASLDSKILTAHTSDSNGFGPCNIWFASGVLQLYSSSNNSSFDVANGATIGTPTVGQWNHMAVSRQGSSIRCFLNGVLGSTTTSSATLMNPTDTFQIAARRGGETFTGYISNFRVVKGTAVYTAAFTPSTSALTAISGTSLLTCQSNRFIDNSTNNFTVTPNGNPRVINFAPFKRTAQYSTTSHGGSAYFDGTGDYLTVADNAAFTLSADFTVECWFYQTGAFSDRIIIDKWSEYYLYTRANGLIGLAWGPYNASGMFGAGGIVQSGNNAFTLNSWTHVAAVRNSNTFTLYVNGTSVSTATNSAAVSDTGAAITIGDYSGGGYAFEGYVSNARIVKGTAVYTTTFTPPTAPLTAIANTSLLTNLTNAGIYDWTTRNVIETIGNAKVNTAITKYGTGSLEFDGTGDVLAVPHSPLWINFLTGDFTIEGWFYARTLTSYNGMVTHWRSNGTTGWTLETVGSGIFFYIRDISTNNYFNAGGGTFTTNQWNHVAVVKNGATITIYLNGTAVGDTLSMTGKTTSESTDPIVIGGMWSNTGPSGGLDTEADWDGFIDDLRITRSARYTANFTPPTSAFRIS
jgi:hypothetical protein